MASCFDNLACFKDLPSHVLCIFKECERDYVELCEKNSLIVKDEDKIDYVEDYVMLCHKNKTKPAERCACNNSSFPRYAFYSNYTIS